MRDELLLIFEKRDQYYIAQRLSPIERPKGKENIYSYYGIVAIYSNWILLDNMNANLEKLLRIDDKGMKISYPIVVPRDYYNKFEWQPPYEQIINPLIKKCNEIQYKKVILRLDDFDQKYGSDIATSNFSKKLKFNRMVKENFISISDQYNYHLPSVKSILSSKVQLQYKSFVKRDKNDGIELGQLKIEDRIIYNLQERKQPLIDFKKFIPQKVKWTQIEINILDEDSIKIKHPSNSFDIRYSQTQNFINKTTTGCNDLWSLLLELSLIGRFQPNNQTYTILTKKPGKAKHRVYALGKALMDEFGIIEKPFLPYNSQDGWLPKFTIRDLRKNIIRTNTQAEIYKSQQTVKRKQYQDSPPKIGNTFSSDDLDYYANEQKAHKDKLDYKDKGFHDITEDKL